MGYDEVEEEVKSDDVRSTQRLSSIMAFCIFYMLQPNVRKIINRLAKYWPNVRKMISSEVLGL